MRNLLLVTVLAGCGIDEEDFLEQYVDVYCTAVVEDCADEATLVLFPDLGTCETMMTDLVGAERGESCVYDPKAAKDCLNESETASCDAWFNEAGPAACSQIYGADCVAAAETLSE